MKKPLAVIFGKPVAANESELEFESDIVFRWIKAAERRCASAIWAGVIEDSIEDKMLFASGIPCAAARLSHL